MQFNFGWTLIPSIVILWLKLKIFLSIFSLTNIYFLDLKVYIESISLPLVYVL